MSTNTKIPYDAVPISRGEGKQKQKRTPAKINKGFAWLVLIVFVFNAALFGLFIYNIKNVSSKILNLNYKVESNSPEISIAASKAKLSTVLVGVGGGNSHGNFSRDNLPTYNQLLSNTSSRGSGVIYKMDKKSGTAYIITCHHVVHSYLTSPVFVCFYDSRQPMYATVRGVLVAGDLAIIQVTGDAIKSSMATEVTLADSLKIVEGDSVFAIGNALQHGTSVDAGIVSMVSRAISLAENGTTYNVRAIKVDAPINKGNSGGGLFDKNGNLIGIVESKDLGTGVDNVAYALPVNLVASVANNIIEGRNGYYAPAGYTASAGDGVGDVELVMQDDGKIIKQYKCYVTNIISTSDAYAAGLRNNDRLVSVSLNGVSYDFIATYVYEDIRFMASKGSQIKYVVERGGKTIEISYTVQTIAQAN